MPDLNVNDPVAVPEPVRKKAAIQGLAVAMWNVACIVFHITAEISGSVNLLIAAGIAYYDVFFLQKQVIPTQGLHDRLAALAPEVDPEKE